MARSRSVFLYCMAAALHNPALSSLVPRCRLALCRSLRRAENPNLPSVSPFRRMMDDAGRPTEGFTLSWLLSSRGGRVLAETNRATIFSLRLRFYDAPDGYQYLHYSYFLIFFKNCIYLASLNAKAHLCRNLEIKIYLCIKECYR